MQLSPLFVIWKKVLCDEAIPARAISLRQLRAVNAPDNISMKNGVPILLSGAPG